MGNFDPRRQGPPGSIPAGGRYMYPDQQGTLHPTPGQAVESNQRVERDLSRGSSGGCGQDASKVPTQHGR